jgi:hypothetical protein
MNPDEDQAWADRIDRALKALPELSAPAGLVEKTMAALERQEKPSWRQQPWPMWPLWLRTLSLLAMAGLVGGIYAVKWDFAERYAGQFVRRLNEHFAGWSVFFGALNSLGHALVMVARSLNGWLAALCLVMPAVAYLTCIGVGTAATRLTFSRR